MEVDRPDVFASLGLDDCPLELGRPVDITGGCGAPLFAVTDCVDHDLVRVDGDGIRFGAPGDDRCTTRPSELGDAIPSGSRAIDAEMPVGYILTREALIADDYGRLDAILAHFAPEADRRDDPAVSGLMGRAHFWALAQYGRAIAAGADPAGAGQHATEQIRRMQHAMSVADYDPKYDSWLGGSLVIAGLQAGDSTLQDQGRALLERGAESYPGFNLFTNGLLASTLPVDDPGFAAAPDAFLTILELCSLGGLDRSNPDFAPFDTDEIRAATPLACRNSEYAPFSLQGFMLFAGDAVLRDGDPGVARVLYENARRLEGWDEWPFQARIQARLDDDLELRSRLLRDDDPSNDPEFVTDDGTCSFCHAR